MEKPSSGGSRRLTRQASSRLQMHAPSSLKVAHADAADVAGWNAAIPLLSPLDATSALRAWDVAAEHEHTREERRRQPTAATTPLPPPPPSAVEAKRETTATAAAATATAWKHPAAPFYYEPAPPGAGPGFLLSLT